MTIIFKAKLNAKPELQCKLNHQAWMKNVKLEETISRVATNTIGYTRKQAKKE
jgi:hypothetical protein